MEGSGDEDSASVTSIEAMALAVAYWLGVSALVGFMAARISPHTLTRLVRSSRWWLAGPSVGWYRRVLRIEAWKDRLPEAGRFAGGVSKRSLKTRDRTVLQRLYLETVRAECVHSVLLVLELAPLLWLDRSFVAVPFVLSVVANVPFIAVQRYNRGRLSRLVRIDDLWSRYE